MPSSPDPEARGKSSGPPARGTLNAALARIPLPARVVFYGVFFLALVLGALPWLASRLEVLLPACGVELGWLRLPGLVFFLGCFVTYVWLSYVLTSRGRGAYVEFDPPDALVTEGPYRWVRNPIAACVVGMLLGESVALSSTGVFLLFLISLLLAHLQVVCLEEPLLRKRFGQAYDDYCARVPRWIPRRPREETP